MENKKISALSPKSINNLDNLILEGKYWVPAYLPEETSQDYRQNGRLDLGQMFAIVKRDIRSVVNDVITQLIASGDIGTGGSSSGGQEGSSSDLTELSTKVANLTMEVNSLKDLNNWPKHFIRLVSGTQSRDYTLATGPGEASPSNQSNPIVIETTNLALPNFLVGIKLNSVAYSEGKVTASVTYEISNKQGSIQFKGGTIGALTITGAFKIDSLEYTYTPLTIDLSGRTLSSSSYETTGEVTVQLQSENTFDDNPGAISTASTTCSVQNIPLGQTSHYISSSSGGSTGTGVVGQITIPNGS